MLDLDGVVYVGSRAVAGVATVLDEAKAAGMSLAFVTNNAARTPEKVAAQLNSLGVAAEPADIVTSAQAAARELAARQPQGTRVLIVGGEGLRAAVADLGLVPDSLDDEPEAVAQGFHPRVGWAQLAEAGYAVRAGATWVASNLDQTVPTARGIAPGNGTLVDAVAAAGGRRPDVVAGKPFRPLFDETLRRVASRRPIVVGDRLDTDIAGAVNCDAHSLLVMTGVTDVAALCAAPSQMRPDFVGWELSSLLSAHEVATHDGDGWLLAGWRISTAGSSLRVDETGADADQGLRAVVSAAWHWHDTHPDEELDVSAASRALAPGRPGRSS